MQITEDGWLSERFGHPAHTVAEPIDPGTLGGHIASRDVASYQARVNEHDRESVERLAQAGFRVVSTAVTLERRGPAPEGETIPVTVTIRDAQPGDAALASTGTRAFRTSRFHLDPEIPDGVAGRIKHDWAENLLTGRRGDGCLVAELDGRGAGFLGILAGEDAWTIDLVAVDPDLQGRGAGRALVVEFLARASARCDLARVGTQVENPEAIRFYERLGFEIVRSDLDLHLHTGGAWERA